MAKSKTDGKGRRARFKKGDLVSFLFGNGTATGQVVEDRSAAEHHRKRPLGYATTPKPSPLYTPMRMTPRR